jgi:hypothetical protein
MSRVKWVQGIPEVKKVQAGENQKEEIMKLVRIKKKK